MGEVQRQALARDLSRQHAALGHDELRVIDRVTVRLLQHRERHGALDLSDLGGLVARLGAGIREGSILDSAISLIAREIADEDAAREHLREAARTELLGVGEREFSPDAHLTRMDSTSAVIALGLIPRDRDKDLEVDIAIDDDPGPHTHVYQGTDQGDECQVCGRMRDQFADLGDEWGVDRDAGGRA